MDLSPSMVLQRFASRHGGINAVRYFLDELNKGTSYQVIANHFEITVGRVSQLRSILCRNVTALNNDASQAFRLLVNDRENDIDKAKAQIIQLAEYDSQRIHSGAL